APGGTTTRSLKCSQMRCQGGYWIGFPERLQVFRPEQCLLEVFEPLACELVVLSVRFKSLQTPDSRRIDVVASCDVRLRLACGKALQCFLPLMRSELAWPSKLHTSLSRTHATLAGAGSDQLALELC